MLRGVGSQLVFDISVQIIGPTFKCQQDQFECWDQLDVCFCRVLLRVSVSRGNWGSVSGC